MGHREVIGVSPRHATALQISDTLLCLGQDPIRSKEGDLRIVLSRGVKVKVHSAYSLTVEVDGHKPFKTRSVIEAQKFLMGTFL